MILFSPLPIQLAFSRSSCNRRTDLKPQKPSAEKAKKKRDWVDHSTWLAHSPRRFRRRPVKGVTSTGHLSVSLCDSSTTCFRSGKSSIVVRPKSGAMFVFRGVKSRKGFPTSKPSFLDAAAAHLAASPLFSYSSLPRSVTHLKFTADGHVSGRRQLPVRASQLMMFTRSVSSKKTEC